MEKILQGLILFREKDFGTHRELFEQLSNSQNPHTLFITCSDSRIDPTLLTQSVPGELFIIRNIANLVPPYRKSEEYLATTSAIEYAVNILEVKNIIICGHSNCGGCNALYASAESLDHIPHTKKWLELAGNVKEKVLAELGDQENPKRGWMTEQMNVLEQLKNLLTYPFIQERYKQGKLSLEGWYYIIGTGEVYIYNKDKGMFELVN